MSCNLFCSHIKLIIGLYYWSRGLYRVHQFSKVEMFVLCRPEESDSFHQELIEIEESLYSSLGLHFKCDSNSTCSSVVPINIFMFPRVQRIHHSSIFTCQCISQDIGYGIRGFRCPSLQEIWCWGMDAWFGTLWRGMGIILAFFSCQEFSISTIV